MSQRVLVREELAEARWKRRRGRMDAARDRVVGPELGLGGFGSAGAGGRERGDLIGADHDEIRRRRTVGIRGADDRAHEEGYGRGLSRSTRSRASTDASRTFSRSSM